MRGNKNKPSRQELSIKNQQTATIYNGFSQYLIESTQRRK